MRLAFRKRLKVLMAGLVFGLATALAAAADSKPDFSGEWTLNVSKSDFGPLPGPSRRIDKIDHKDPNLKIDTIVVSQQGESTRQWSCTTDGKECSNTTGPASLKSTAQWEGSTLTINSKGTFNDNAVQIKDKWNLSEDGKTLTINRHLASAQGEGDQTLILEKH